MRRACLLCFLRGGRVKPIFFLYLVDEVYPKRFIPTAASARNCCCAQRAQQQRLFAAQRDCEKRYHISTLNNNENEVVEALGSSSRMARSMFLLCHAPLNREPTPSVRPLCSPSRLPSSSRNARGNCVVLFSGTPQTRCSCTTTAR